jgi:hypothetical protein
MRAFALRDVTKPLKISAGIIWFWAKFERGASEIRSIIVVYSTARCGGRII